MFDRFVRLAQARRALRQGHFDEALRLVEDPLVRDHRRARDLRGEVGRRLIERAEARRLDGAAAEARSDLERAEALCPDHPDLRLVRTAIEADGRRVEEGLAKQAALIVEARLALAGADLTAAASRGEQARAIQGGAELERLLAMIETARERVRRHADEAEIARREGRPLDALQSLVAAREIDGSDERIRATLETLLKSHGVAIQKELSRLVSQPSAQAGAEQARALRARIPELRTIAGHARVFGEFDTATKTAVMRALEAVNVPEARQRLTALGPGGPDASELTQLVDGLARAEAAADAGDFALAVEFVDPVAKAIGGAGLKALRDRWLEAAQEVGRRLDVARDLARQGRLADARSECLAILEGHPSHVGACSQMRVLEAAAKEREQRIAEAREAVRTGRLHQAASQLVGLVVPGGDGDEVRRMLAEVERRGDVVKTGLRQVLARLHDRTSAGREGLQSCDRRLVELEKLQADDPEVCRVRAAIAAELGGLDAVDAARHALDGDEIAGMSAALDRLFAGRDSLLQPDRLDARAAELVDDAVCRAERALAMGAAGRARRLTSAIAPWSGVVPGLGRRCGELTAAVAAAAAKARERVDEARRALENRDLATADAALDAARALAADEPEVVHLASDLLRLRSDDDALHKVSQHADRRDFGAAQRELGQMGPTPAFLRTRVFDLKKAIAKAQGLEGAFLLRVDEGGEFLVIRGESLSIGNLREKACDLPMLANVAGRHARLRRTMSFHGGQQDKVVAENGVLSSDGREVRELVLRGRTRFRLGATVELEYRLPSERSLSALLTVLGGFQIAGTDRVIWMKDRGRDGRILIGPSRDSHVVVPGAESEVEVFADRDGRIRVRVTGSGDLDDKPIHGEHPASAGSTLRCGSLSLVMLPWHRA